MLTPRLTTAAPDGRVITLRAPEPGDAPRVQQMMSDPGTTCWLADLPQPYLLEHAESFLASRAPDWAGEGPGVEWTFAIETGDRFTGLCGVRPDGGIGDLGYVMHPDSTGHGVMTQALRRLGAWALDPDGAGLQTLTWRAVRGNWASRRVAWHCGYRFGGTLRAGAVRRDGPVDLWLASLRRGDRPSPVEPWLTPPPITIGDLVLRAADEADLPRIQEACDDPQTARNLPQLPSPYTLADAERYLLAAREEMALGTALVWAVAAADAPDVLLGMVALDQLGCGPQVACEVGYWVHPAARRRSVATVGCRAATRHALLPVEEGGLGRQSVLLRAEPGNEGSRRVARAAGFVRTGFDPDTVRGRDGQVGGFERFHFTADRLESAWAHPSSLR